MHVLRHGVCRSKHAKEVLRRINGLRLEVIQTPGKKQHFEKAVASFTHVVDDDDDPTAVRSSIAHSPVEHRVLTLVTWARNMCVCRGCA